MFKNKKLFFDFNIKLYYFPGKFMLTSQRTLAIIAHAKVILGAGDIK